MTQADCLFCGIVAGAIPSTKVDEDELTYAFMDISPATPGHALVVPKRHSTNIYDVPPEDLAAVVAAAQRLALRVRDGLGADGVNLNNACGPAAGQTVFHFHFHVIPRYSDPARDSLKLPWIPKPGDPDSIAATAAALRG